MPTPSKCTWCTQHHKTCTVPEDSKFGKCTVCIKRGKPCSFSKSSSKNKANERDDERGEANERGAASERESEEPIVIDSKPSTPEACKIEARELSYLERAKLKRKREASEVGERAEVEELKGRLEELAGEFKELKKLVKSLQEGVDVLLEEE